MPDETSPEPPEATTAPEGEVVEDKSEAAPPPKPTETVDFWKAKAREQERRAKENATKAAEFDKVTESQKSDLQKALERAEAAEKQALALASEKQQAEWRSEASKATKGRVPAEVLRGSTQEEIDAHAASLVALLSNSPQSSFDHGPRQQSAPQSMNDLIFGAAKRR